MKFQKVVVTPMVKKIIQKWQLFLLPIFWGYTEPKRTIVSWQTTNKNNYLKIKNELSSLGFKVVNIPSDSDCGHLAYKKGKFLLNLYSCQRPDDQGIFNATYEISITDIKE